MSKAMQHATLAYLKQNPDSTFADLDRHIVGFHGSKALWAPGYNNIVLWPAVSEDAGEAIDQLWRNGRLKMEPITGQLSEYVMCFTGRHMALPIILEPRQGLLTEHFLPLQLRVKG